MRLLVLSHQQIVIITFVAAGIVGAGFMGANGYWRGDVAFEEGASDLEDLDDELVDASDLDNDGLPDRLESSQYGTDPTNPDTDGDGLDDGWEVLNGLNPLDSGDAAEDDLQDGGSSDADTGDENESWPNPDNGPNGDPDRDGMTNLEEAGIGTNPNLRDTDGDGLNDKWEADNQHEVQVGETTFTLLDPLNANWQCPLLTPSVISALQLKFDAAWKSLHGENWEDMANPDGEHSCDYVLDVDVQGPDGLPNYLEEFYGTDPLDEDSDGDLLSDPVEISILGEIELLRHCGKPLVETITTTGPFSSISGGSTAFFRQDMDGDGRLNGPSDWDTDGDGMPDGFEYCFAPQFLQQPTGLNPSNSSDAWGDADEDSLNNLDEFLVSLQFGPANYTNPFLLDTDQDGMPDGWEANNGINPVDGSNGDEDPDMDGWDLDGDGLVRYSSLIATTTVTDVRIELGEWVEANSTLFIGRTIVNGVQSNVPIAAPSSGYIYAINVDLQQRVETRDHVWAVVVESEERFTNLQEYNARDRDGDGTVDGRSTNPTNPDTDGDGLRDGIEVLGWNILVVERGVKAVRVTSDPGLYDTDGDGLSDFREYNASFTNASNADTDGDGLSDYTEVVDGFTWDETPYITNASMFDTDNDGLADGEEVIEGADSFVTHANDSDTDDDGLKDGAEALNIPRPWQSATSPLDNDTDDDGMLDGWEMQVESAEDNTKSHSLWIVTENWMPPGCDSLIQCGLAPGGYLWINGLRGFEIGGDVDGDGLGDPKYFIHQMNLSGFSVPNNDKCSCAGRWALDPAQGTLADANFDIDNDTLLNSQEAPDRWNTNPIDNDTDGDRLPDGWEVSATERAFELGIANGTYDPSYARGPLDPAIADSDGDGIGDGEEDPDSDGLNRTGLLNRYCPGWNDPLSSLCHIDPDTADGKRFYDDLENFTNYEEYVNGTDPINNDTDGDGWEDGSEVYHQDHDGDGLSSGWEYYYQFDPFDAGDRNLDVDGDGIKNICEFFWDTNPRDPTSFPGQGQSCDQFD